MERRTLDATGSGANVNLDGAAAVARIDPPDTGSMSTSSTFRILGTSVANFLPGTLNFAAGNGIYVAGEMKADTQRNATFLEFTATEVDGKLKSLRRSIQLYKTERSKTGEWTSALPMLTRVRWFSKAACNST